MEKVCAKWVLQLLLMVPLTLSAQEVGTSDDLEEFDDVDICFNPKYAIVTKDGKQGIYDMMLHEKVTDVEFREIVYAKESVAEDSIKSNMFYAKKGIRLGMVFVSENDNSVASIWIDDPDEVCLLDDCTTIDPKVTKKATKLLKRLIEREKMENAQLAVLDAATGRLLTWVALDADMTKESAGKLLRGSCSMSLAKPFVIVAALESAGLTLDSMVEGQTIREAIMKCDARLMKQVYMKGARNSYVESKWDDLSGFTGNLTNPLYLAILYNSLVHNGAVISPTLRADSVKVEEDLFTPSMLAVFQRIFVVDKTMSPQLRWLSDEACGWGYATTETIYAEEDEERLQGIGKQIEYAGVFPHENPRYTICIVGDKLSMDATPSLFQSVVNPLAAWLLKRK